jgi:diguanylate cyclase (GGDEF)-like protein
MDVPSLAFGYDPWIVLLSCLIAMFASYVAFDLVERVRNPDHAVSVGRGVGGSMVMGTGIWAMHFVGMLAAKLPFAVGYDYWVTAASWLAAVSVSAVALGIASRPQLKAGGLVGGALAMGAGICAMHYTGMAALGMAPAIRWDPLLVAVSVAIAVGASAAALLLLFQQRRVHARRALLTRCSAALVMGAAISGMHYTGMAAAGFAEGAVCLSDGQLRGDGLGLLVSASVVGLLTLIQFTSVLEARLQGKTVRLAQSLREVNEELQRLAFRDALTGLPNRLLFDDRVALAVERCMRDRATLAVLFVDLDGFKPINDSFGHAFGDRVLREVAKRLAAQARSCDTLARVGGDEFVALLDGRPDSAAAARVAQRIIDAVSAPVVLSEHEVRLSCSVGIAMYPADGEAGQLMGHADAAMYAAKRAGGSTYAFFEAHMDEGVRAQVELQRDLRQALDQGGQLVLHYQPKVGAADSVITGTEALVRWNHPVRGLLSPGVFVPVAERFGLIGRLGHWVIDEACRQSRAWLDQGLRLRVAVNLSVHQLRQDDLPERVQRLLDKHGVDAGLLSLEVTESAAMDDAAGTLRAFERLGRLGVRLSIDDFGTGYSSLSYLRRLQVDQLKIDRSFVNDLEHSADARAIVEAVVRLAHALGMTVVGEGVETSAQRDVLRELGCDELQGFLFARPMPAHRMTLWAFGVDRPTGVAFSDSTFAGLELPGKAARLPTQ